MKKPAFSKSWVVFGQLAVLFLTAAAHGDVCYYITNTNPVRGYALNDSAQVVGYLNDGTGLWQNGSVTDLGMLPGYAMTGAEGISASGRYVAGYAFNGGLLDGRGVLWTDGVIAELPPLPGDASSSALKVNDAGIAVGTSALPGITYPDGVRPVYWENGVPHQLPTLGGAYGDALDINNAGTIVGDTERGDGTWGTTLWVNGVPVDVGGLPGYAGSWSRAINESGQAAVNSSGPAGGGHQYRAALWDNGAFTEVQELPGRPNTYSYGVNSLEEIVGWSFVEYIGDAIAGAFVDPVAFVWRDGATYDLNSLIPADSGWYLRWARDINDRGQIVARGYNNSQSGGVLLTPIPILTPELSGGGTADVVYDRYGNVGGYAAGLPGSSELVGGSTDLDNFQLTGAFATLMLHYDEDDLLYRSIAEESLRLYWYNGLLSQWVLAGNNANLTWNPAAQFVLGAPTDVLGDWGLNMADDYVWANIDHASTYSVGGLANVPVPGAMLLGILGIGVAAATRRIRRR